MGGIAKIPEILDVGGQLIGEDLILWVCTVFGKPAKKGKATPCIRTVTSTRFTAGDNYRLDRTRRCDTA